MSEGFATFDHTGDLGLEVWAKSPERLMALAAEALLAQVAEARDPAVDMRLELALRGQDEPDLLVHWLNTALLEAELHRVHWVKARILSLTPTSLQGTLEGQRRDPARQVFLREIKAVSHHGLSLTMRPPDCRCRLILDL